MKKVVKPAKNAVKKEVKAVIKEVSAPAVEIQTTAFAREVNQTDLKLAMKQKMKDMLTVIEGNVVTKAELDPIMESVFR